MLLSTVLVALLLRQTSIADVAQVLAGSRWSWILAGFAIYALANWFKALRFRLITQSDTPISRLDVYEATCLYNMATGILPFGTGELSYPYLMYRWHGVRITQSTPALVVTRLFDLIAVSLLFLVSTLVLRRDLAVSPNLILAAAVVLAAAALGLVLAPWLGDWGLALLNRVNRRWLRGRWLATGERLLGAGRRFVENLRQANSPALLLRLALHSLIIWILSYLVFLAVFWALGFDMTYWMTSFAGSLVLMTNLLPIQGIAGLGVREVGWVLGLVALGFGREQATTLAFSVHAVTLSYLIVLGLLGGALAAGRRNLSAAPSEAESP